MAGLLDSINRQISTPEQAPAMGATKQVGGLLRAKLGKASTASAVPAQSNIQEQLAQADTKSQLGQIAQVGQIQGAGMQQQAADQALQAKQQGMQHAENLAGLQDKFSQQTNSILDELRNNQATLSANQKMAKMEQAGFMIRGMNDNYVRELKRQGDLSRLHNNTNFREALAHDIMDEDMSLFKSTMEFKKTFDVSDREFATELANMSDNFALKMADIAAKQSNTQMQYAGASSAISSGLNYADKQAKVKTTDSQTASQGVPSSLDPNSVSMGESLAPSLYGSK